MTTILNLTPHPVHIVGPEGKVLATFVVAGAPARCREIRESDGVITVGSVEIPMARKRYGEITGLPAVQEGTIYVVSLLVAWHRSRKRPVAKMSSTRTTSCATPMAISSGVGA